MSKQEIERTNELSRESSGQTDSQVMIGSFDLVVIKTNTMVDKVYGSILMFAVIFANINMGV